MLRYRASTVSAHRATAWLLLWICLWMGTGVALHHTDAAAPNSASAPIGASHWSATVPVDLCAACAWSQGLQSGTVTFCPVPTPLFTLLPLQSPKAQTSVCPAVPRRSPRAPPVTLSA